MKSPPAHVVSETNTPLYDVIRFWGRKPHNIVNAYVRQFAEPDEVVFDPFAGSGVTALEALRADRRAVYNDLNPLFTFVARTSAAYTDLDALEAGFETVMESLSGRSHPLVAGDETTERGFDWLYATRCRQCDSDEARILETEATRKYATTSDAPERIPDEPGATTRNGHPDVPDALAGEGTLDRLAREILRLMEDEGTISHAALLDRLDLDRFGDARKSEVTRAINDRLFDAELLAIERDVPTSITYDCPACATTETVGPTEEDLAHVEEIDRFEPGYYYPDDELVYPDGRRFYTYRPGTERVDRLFTTRNRVALAILRHEIRRLRDRGYGEAVVDALLLGFVAVLEHVSRMQRPNKKGWAAKNYVVHPENLELNVARAFRNRFETLVRACREANEELNDTEPVGDRCRFLTGDARETPLADGAVDYVFTDPEYGDSVQYFELSYMAARWLDVDPNWTDEIVVNPRQAKRRERYERMLAEAFEEVFRVLRPGGHLTVTFHSREYGCWNSLLYAILQAGFEYVDAVYQVPRREYTNWINRRKPGSMNGDVYITFHRPAKANASTASIRRGADDDGRDDQDDDGRDDQDDDGRDDGPVDLDGHDAAVRSAAVSEARDVILAHDGEATFEQLVRGVTLRLIDDGVMHAELVRELEYERLFDERFQRVDGDRRWRLPEGASVSETEFIPLSRRIRWVIEAAFARREDGSIGLDDLLSRVFTTLTDARTPEHGEILDVLEQVARPVETNGETAWRRRDSIDGAEETRRRQLDRDRIVEAVARAGRDEPGLAVRTVASPSGRNRSVEPAGDRTPLAPTPAEATCDGPEPVDVIWVAGDRPVCLFAVYRGAEAGYSTDFTRWTRDAAKPGGGLDRLAEGCNGSPTDPVGVWVIPDRVGPEYAELVRESAVEDIAGTPDRHVLTYTALLAALDELSARPSENTWPTVLADHFAGFAIGANTT